MLNNLALTENDFALQPEEFVQKCIDVACLQSITKDTPIFHQYVSALRTGRTRISVANAIAHFANPILVNTSNFTYNSLNQTMDNYLVTDMLLNFAPDDDIAFMTFAANKILGRAPKNGELLPIEFDFRRKIVTRLECINWLTQHARASGRNLIFEGLHSSSAIPNNFGFSYDENGSKQFVAVNSNGFGSWQYAPNIISQNHSVNGSRWHVQSGWLMAGPKVSFEPGTWLLKLDFVQPESSALIIDVVANSGLDVLFCQEFVGSVAACIKLNIEKFHFFLELRIFKPLQDSNLCWITPRKIVLVKLD